MVKGNISLYERKKEIIIKTWTFDERKSSYYEFFRWRKRLCIGFLGVKVDLFQRRKLVERSFISLYETCMIF